MEARKEAQTVTEEEQRHTERYTALVCCGYTAGQVRAGPLRHTREVLLQQVSAGVQCHW